MPTFTPSQIPCFVIVVDAVATLDIGMAGPDYVPPSTCDGNDLGFMCLEEYVTVEFDTRDCLSDKVRIWSKKKNETEVKHAEFGTGCSIFKTSPQFEDGRWR